MTMRAPQIGRLTRLIVVLVCLPDGAGAFPSGAGIRSRAPRSSRVARRTLLPRGPGPSLAPSISHQPRRYGPAICLWQLKDPSAAAAAVEEAQRRRRQSLRAGRHPLLSLNLNLDAMARAEAPEHAQMLYQKILALHDEGYYPVRPDLVSFNTVLKAFRDDPEGALAFWEREAGAVVPSIRSYNVFLLALANAGLGREAETLLRHMQEPGSAARPDLVTYNTVLLAHRFAPDADAPERAQALLWKMIDGDDGNDDDDDANTTVRPDAISFNTVMAAWACRDTEAAVARVQACFDLMRQHGVKPDVYSFTTLIQAYSRRRGESRRCLDQLRAMRAEAEPPNRVTYTLVLQALSRDRQLDAATDLLEEMWELDDPLVRPDVITYSALMDAWASVAEVQPLPAIAAVRRLLAQMQARGVTPNEQTYTSVLATIARARQPDAGDQTLAVIREMHAAGLSADVIHYNVALDALSKSPNVNKVADARRVWQEMLENGAQPNTITYNSLLSVASTAFGPLELRRQGLKLAMEAFRAIQKDPECQSTSLTFSYIFRAVRKFAPPSSERFRIIRQIFILCCQEGCLNDVLLSYLRQQACSAEEFRVLLGDHWKDKVTLAELPSEWRQNALAYRPRRHRDKPSMAE